MDIRIVMAVLALCACTVAQVSHDPDCAGRGIECPLYTVLGETPEYQLRRYDPSTWACTTSTVNRDTWREEKRQMFWRLFQYINHTNDQNVKISMTAPVVKKFNYRTMESTMCFFVPLTNNQAPQPTNEAVRLDNWPVRDYYVSSYGGFAGRWTSMKSLRDMQAAIGNDQLYDMNDVMSAGYDAPWKRTDRHNEMWLARVNPTEPNVV